MNVLEIIKAAIEELTAKLEKWNALPVFLAYKPYPNEHAARVEKPEKYDEVRRENAKFGEGIDAIWKVIKGPPRKVELQAIRFSTDKFTADEARAWLKEHDIKYILFEPASEKAVSVEVKEVTQEFKLVAILDKIGKDARSTIVKSGEDYKAGTVHRVFTLNKGSFLPAPDLPRSATIYLSTRDLDHDGDIVTPSDWDLAFYKGQGLWAHNYQLDPIYKAIETQADDYGLWQLIQFAETDRGANYWHLVKNGFLQTFSAGMWAKKGGAIARGDAGFDAMIQACQKWPEFTADKAGNVQRFIAKKWLIESSLCNIPANPLAMVVAVAKGEVTLCDEVKHDIRYEDMLRKAVDSGAVDKSLARTPTAPPKIKIEAVPGPKVTVKAVPKVEHYLTLDELQTVIEKNIEKTVARIRGAI
jgi:phage head maturation protease